MDDNEIKKALKCLSSDETVCNDCKYEKFKFPKCQRKVAKNALDLINRQKAEIERLQNSGIRASSVADWLLFCNKLRAEAIKEFAERLKRKSKKRVSDQYGERIFFKDIDNLLEEMESESNE